MREKEEEQEENQASFQRDFEEAAGKVAHTTKI